MIELGNATKESGEAAYQALERAVKDYQEGCIDILVTSPINKNSIQNEEFNFPGHTEYLQERLGNGNKSLMILCSGNLRFAIATSHLPLRDVPSAITPELLEEKLTIFNKSLREDFDIDAPKIAVLSLNPHSGDNGLLGREEIEIIAPTIEKMSREEGMPYVVDPKVIEPKQFLKEVVEVRLPNPFMPDTPQRIATDTSQKLSIRYGETVKAVLAAGNNPADLTLIPLVQAGWLRYLLGVDDEGAPFELSPDPLLPAMQQRMEGIALGKEFDAEQLKPILSDAAIFGLDLYECGLAEKVLGYFRELIAGPGAVRATLKKYVY
jgi:hypothetical protein